MFKVPIIPPDLRHEETIIQAAYALDCLQRTIATIFGRIDNRIEKNNVKVKQLQERIVKSQAKLNSLQGTRKAITIYAPARFPSSTIFKDIPATFNEKDKVPLRRVEKYKIKSKMDPNLPNINEKLIFFHVSDENGVELASDSPLAKERLNIKRNQNLGNMPSDLRSVSSVLLFNTDSCVYNLHDSGSETLGRSEAWKRAKLLKGKRQKQQKSSKHFLEPAPHSLVHRRNDKLTPSGGLKYTPKLTEAPELDLPLDLPDLPGIADDLRYESLEAKQKIAPSLALVVENLPDLTELMKDDDKKSQILSEGAKYNSTIIAPPPPPPPPPAPPGVLSLIPPPPPPLFTKQQVSQVKTDLENNTQKISSSSDTHSDLMAAIRKAGGIEKARLRPTAAAPLAKMDKDVVDNTHINNSSIKKSNSLSNSHGGDLMADLHNKLLMRRKGISGSKENKDDASNINIKNTVAASIPSGNPLLSRLSSLIPPPPTVTKNIATTSGEDDEDDSNDADWVD